MEKEITIIITGYEIHGSTKSADEIRDAYMALAAELYPDAKIIDGGAQDRTYGGRIVSVDGDDNAADFIEHQANYWGIWW